MMRRILLFAVVVSLGSQLFCMDNGYEQEVDAGHRQELEGVSCRWYHCVDESLIHYMQLVMNDAFSFELARVLNHQFCDWWNRGHDDGFGPENIFWKIFEKRALDVIKTRGCSLFTRGDFEAVWRFREEEIGRLFIERDFTALQDFLLVPEDNRADFDRQFDADIPAFREFLFAEGRRFIVEENCYEPLEDRRCWLDFWRRFWPVLRLCQKFVWESRGSHCDVTDWNGNDVKAKIDRWFDRESAEFFQMYDFVYFENTFESIRAFIDGLENEAMRMFNEASFNNRLIDDFEGGSAYCAFHEGELIGFVHFYTNWLSGSGFRTDLLSESEDLESQPGQMPTELRDFIDEKHSQGKPCVYLAPLVVRRDFQGKGIGRRLLCESVKGLSEREDLRIDYVYGRVSLPQEEISPALGFYYHVGHMRNFVRKINTDPCGGSRRDFLNKWLVYDCSYLRD